MNFVKIKTEDVVNQNFLSDTQDFFAERRKGHMGIWRYSEPKYLGDRVNGMLHWAEFVRAAKNGSDYYCYRDEISAINNALPFAQSIFNSPANLIDLGPGSEEAIAEKPGRFIHACDNIQYYTAFDIVPELVTRSIDYISTQFPHLKTHGEAGNFYTHELNLPDGFTPIMMFFGQTMFNLPIDPFDTEKPKKIMVQCLKKLRLHVAEKNSFLVVTQDTNQELMSLYNAYMVESKFNLNLLHRIKRDLPVSNDFDPEAFAFEPYFIEETGALSHTYVCKNDVNFSLNNENFDLKKGQRFFMHNTYKLSDVQFRDMAIEAGYEPVACIKSDNTHCALHILKSNSFSKFLPKDIAND